MAAGLTAIPQLSGGVPQAYVRVLVFNRDSALVDQLSQQLTKAAQGNYEPLRLQVVLPQDGYVSAYVGSQSDVDVFFDDVQVEHRPGLQVQENQYDPWGLSLAGLDYSAPGIQGLNKHQFNGKERQNDLGLNWSDYGARFYDAQIGRWHSVDPLAEKMTDWSSYGFSFDNPLKFVDVDGRIPYPITIRAFSPHTTFGFGFHGDGRGYSTNLNATARLHERINFDTDKAGFTAIAWSSKTFMTSDPSGAKRAIPSLLFTKNLAIGHRGDSKTFNFGTSAASANPKTPPGTPDINVFSDFSITENKKAGTLSITGKLTGDNFPSTEAFISDPNGQSLFIGVGQIGADVGRNTGPFTELPGENRDNPIASFSLTITTNKEGNFTGVKAGNKTYTIEDWNKLFQNTQPQQQK